MDDLRLKQMRGVWGWVFCAAWIGFWWFYLEGQRQAALAEPCPENLMTHVGDFFFGQGHSCRSAINSKFTNGLVFTFLTSPLGFVAAHYYAKWRVDGLADAQARAAEQAESKRRKAYDAAQEAMAAQVRLEQANSRASGDRFEIITRLGAVDDQLVVLEKEAAAENVKLIKLNIGQSIRDIHARFRGEELAAFYAGDEGLRQRVHRTLAEMRKRRLGKSRLYRDLADLFGIEA